MVLPWSSGDLRHAPLRTGRSPGLMLASSVVPAGTLEKTDAERTVGPSRGQGRLAGMTTGPGLRVPARRGRRGVRLLPRPRAGGGHGAGGRAGRGRPHGGARADPPGQPGRGGARPEPSGQRWPGDAARRTRVGPPVAGRRAHRGRRRRCRAPGPSTGRPGLAGQGTARPRRRAARRALCGRAQAPDRSPGPGAEAGDRRPAGQRRRARVQQRPHRDRRQRPARRGRARTRRPAPAPWICCAGLPARASR